MNHLADTAWGWPGGEDYAGRNDYTEPEDWTAALRQAATGLEGWATHWDSPAAQEALRWVGKSLNDLWD